MYVRFTEEPINPATVYDLLTARGTGAAGSLLFHFAVVKTQAQEGKVTAGIEYQATGDVEEELAAIATTLSGRWCLTDVVVLRRTGRVGIGEIISLVATGSPNSQDAFEACQFGIECLKKMRTIAKSEFYA